MTDRTNRFRKPERRAAYEAALRLAEAKDGLQPGDHLAIARQLDSSIPRDARKQIAAKAVRVTRWRKRGQQ